MFLSWKVIDYSFNCILQYGYETGGSYRGTSTTNQFPSYLLVLILVFMHHLWKYKIVTSNLKNIRLKSRKHHQRHAFSEKIDSLSRNQDNDAVFPQILTLFQKTRQNHENKQMFDFDGKNRIWGKRKKLVKSLKIKK